MSTSQLTANGLQLAEKMHLPSAVSRWPLANKKTSPGADREGQTPGGLRIKRERATRVRYNVSVRDVM